MTRGWHFDMALCAVGAARLEGERDGPKQEPPSPGPWTAPAHRAPLRGGRRPPTTDDVHGATRYPDGDILHNLHPSRHQQGVLWNTEPRAIIARQRHSASSGWKLRSKRPAPRSVRNAAGLQSGAHPEPIALSANSCTQKNKIQYSAARVKGAEAQDRGSSRSSALPRPRH